MSKDLGALALTNEPSLRLPEAIENPFSKLPIGIAKQPKQIWAIGGGKGGVGKSLISSSLAMTLAKTGKSVVAVDLDFGGANLHTSMGVAIPSKTLGDFVSQKVNDLAPLMVDTRLPNLKMISGAQDSVTSAAMDLRQKARLMQAVLSIQSDYIVLDLGAGSHSNTVDFFLLADLGIVTVLPEPTSIENAYRFIKMAYFSQLLYSTKLERLHPLIQDMMGSRTNPALQSPADLYKEAQKISPDLAKDLKSEIDRFKPKLLLNQARTQADVEIGFSIKTVCKKYFGIDLDYVGYLDYDSAVWQAIRKKKPLLEEFPNSRLVSSFDRAVQHMIYRCGDQESALTENKIIRGVSR